MQGVTTAIVAFIFICLVFPSMVRNRPQYYWCVAMVLAVILLDALARMIGSGGFAVFAYVVTAFLQIAAITVLILAVGGLTPRQLVDELAEALEAMRRGETTEDRTVVVVRGAEAPAAAPQPGQEPEDMVGGPPAPPQPHPQHEPGRTPEQERDRSIPLE